MPTENRVNLNEVSQQARIDKVTDLLVLGKSRAWIVEQIMNEWEVSKRTAQTIIDEAMVHILDHSKQTPEQIKALNYNRLENIIGETETVQDKCRVIDLENKMFGIYETNLNVNTKDNTFKFEIDLN
jgi:hypothetical protein